MTISLFVITQIQNYSKRVLPSLELIHLKESLQRMIHSQIPTGSKTPKHPFLDVLEGVHLCSGRFFVHESF